MRASCVYQPCEDTKCTFSSGVPKKTHMYTCQMSQENTSGWGVATGLGFQMTEEHKP